MKLRVLPAIALAAILAGCGTAHSTATSSSKNPGVQVSDPASAAGAMTPMPATPSPATPSPTANPVQEWWSTVSPAVSAIISDFGKLSTDAGNADFPAAGADCQQLQADIQTAQAAAPIADASLEQQWASALGDYQTSASDCVTGIEDNDADLLSQASSEESAGTAAITALTTEIKNEGA